MENKIPSPIFILGAQRSGTTLLRLMLNSHSKIAIPEEGGFWMPLLREYRNKKKNIEGNLLGLYIEYVQNHPQFKLWNIDVSSVFDCFKSKGSVTLYEFIHETYKTFATAGGKSIWGDKTPSFFRMMPVLKSLFPDAMFIHMIRDGRDIYLSRRKLDPTMSNVSVNALEWVYKVRRARRDLELIDSSHYYELRYEDIVKSPNDILQSICDFLNIAFEKKMLEFWTQSDKFIGAHHSKLIFQPVSTKSVGKWKNKMTVSELKRFELIAKKELLAFDYDISQKKISVTEYIKATLDLAAGLPFRLARVVLIALNMRLSSKYGIRLFSEKVGDAPAAAEDKKEKTS